MALMKDAITKATYTDKKSLSNIILIRNMDSVCCKNPREIPIKEAREFIQMTRRINKKLDEDHKLPMALTMSCALRNKTKTSSFANEFGAYDTSAYEIKKRGTKYFLGAKDTNNSLADRNLRQKTALTELRIKLQSQGYKRNKIYFEPEVKADVVNGNIVGLRFTQYKPNQCPK